MRSNPFGENSQPARRGEIRNREELSACVFRLSSLVRKRKPGEANARFSRHGTIKLTEVRIDHKEHYVKSNITFFWGWRTEIKARNGGLHRFKIQGRGFYRAIGQFCEVMTPSDEIEKVPEPLSVFELLLSVPENVNDPFGLTLTAPLFHQGASGPEQTVFIRHIPAKSAIEYEEGHLGENSEYGIWGRCRYPIHPNYNTLAGIQHIGFPAGRY